MRFINHIFTASMGAMLSNQDLLQLYEPALKALPLDEPDYFELRNFVRYYLMGQRTRQVIQDLTTLQNFKTRASAFEKGAEEALNILAAQILSSSHVGTVSFDAILTTTSTGHLMPGLSYRMAHRLRGYVRPDSMLLDLGDVGCTGSLKAINLVRSLNESIENILIVAVEMPSTLMNLSSTNPDVWQGNCTFGDGAAALWISSRADRSALRLDDIRYTQETDGGLNLIHWAYDDYYTYRLAEEKVYNRDSQRLVAQALDDIESLWRGEPYWAVHPACITLLLRLAQKMDLPRDMLKPATEHYRQYSNMSSAGILYILKDVAEVIPEHASIHLLTMGTGFNVIYGRVQKEG